MTLPAARPPPRRGVHRTAPRGLQLLSPRYWPTWLFVAWLWLAARLPHRWMLALHMGLGRLMGRLLHGPSRIVRRNLELCFPGLAADAREKLLMEHFAALGAAVGETGVAWFGNEQRVLRLCRITGHEHLLDALGRGKGVLLYTGHFTGIEICGLMLKLCVPRLAFMFSHRGNALLDRFQARGRARATRVSFSTDDVRSLLRALRQNCAIWYAPDRVYHGPGSRLIPFFGVPAMTHTATSRIARLSGAAVVPFSYRRLPEGAGYALDFLPALEDFPSDDDEFDTDRLVAVLEELIGRCPEQYLWTHRKFRDRPPPYPDAYRRR